MVSTINHNGSDGWWVLVLSLVFEVWSRGSKVWIRRNNSDVVHLQEEYTLLPYHDVSLTICLSHQMLSLIAPSVQLTLTLHNSMRIYILRRHILLAFAGFDICFHWLDCTILLPIPFRTIITFIEVRATRDISVTDPSTNAEVWVFYKSLWEVQIWRLFLHCKKALGTDSGQIGGIRAVGHLADVVLGGTESKKRARIPSWLDIRSEEWLETRRNILPCPCLRWVWLLLSLLLTESGIVTRSV